MVDDREEAIVIKVIEDMPAGTIGLEASGKVTEEDYRDVLVPALNAAIERRARCGCMYVLDERLRVLRAGRDVGRHQAVVPRTFKGLGARGDRLRRRLARERGEGASDG